MNSIVKDILSLDPILVSVILIAAASIYIIRILFLYLGSRGTPDENLRKDIFSLYTDMKDDSASLRAELKECLTEMQIIKTEIIHLKFLVNQTKITLQSWSKESPSKDNIQSFIQYLESQTKSKTYSQH